MNKYLIFRTDRIGDFLLSLILIKSIKRNDPNCHITVVCSEKNYDYIKSFKIIDRVKLLRKGFLNKLKTFFSLNKQSYKSIIIHDLKNRSKILSYFLKSKNKYNPSNKNIISYIDEIKKILNNLDFLFVENDLDTLDDRSLIQSNYTSGDYILLHFDEKWIHNEYIKHYLNIEPSEDQLFEFLIELSNKTNKNIIITSGKKTPIILENVLKKKVSSKIKLIKNLPFEKLETVIINSSLLISCHGAVSHVAAARKIQQIDIIDPSYSYHIWSAHFRNYRSINRSNFINLSKNIINLL